MVGRNIQALGLFVSAALATFGSGELSASPGLMNNGGITISISGWGSLPSYWSECIKIQNVDCGSADITCFCKASTGDLLTSITTCAKSKCNGTLDVSDVNAMLEPLESACTLVGVSIPSSCSSGALGVVGSGSASASSYGTVSTASCTKPITTASCTKTMTGLSGSILSTTVPASAASGSSAGGATSTAVVTSGGCWGSGCSATTPGSTPTPSPYTGGAERLGAAGWAVVPALGLALAL